MTLYDSVNVSFIWVMNVDSLYIIFYGIKDCLKMIRWFIVIYYWKRKGIWNVNS